MDLPGPPRDTCSRVALSIRTCISRRLCSLEFIASLSDLMVVAPGCSLTCTPFLEAPGWARALAFANYTATAPKGASNFRKAVTPLLVGVGGYGLVDLAFEDQWGMPFALKRQNMTMVVEKGHLERARLEGN